MTYRMRLFAFDFQGPAHLSAGLWRHEQDRGHRYTDLRYWTDYARLLEQARFDGIFFADNVGYHDVYEGNADAALAGFQTALGATIRTPRQEWTVTATRSAPGSPARCVRRSAPTSR